MEININNIIPSLIIFIICIYHEWIIDVPIGYIFKVKVKILVAFDQILLLLSLKYLVFLNTNIIAISYNDIIRY